MQIHQVDLDNRREVGQFIGFPFELYRFSSQWVPPLVSSMWSALDSRKHPFYRRSEAAFFLARSDGHMLGRLAVLNNPNYNEYHASQTAFFGYFDAVEDREVSLGLFGAGLDWARARGLRDMIGPRGINGADSGGVLVEGFEHRPDLGVPYNLPYYDSLIQSAGLEKEVDMLSGQVGRDYQLPERLYRIAEQAKRRRGFWVKTFRSRGELREWVPRVLEAHRQAFSSNRTYYPPTAEEVQQLTRLLFTIAVPSLIRLVMHEQEVAALILIYPDISAALKRSRGRLWPVGWWFVLAERRRTRLANANGLAVLPRYRGLGANAILYTELADVLHKSRFERLDLVQADENNVKVQAEAEALGISWYKRHRSYRRSV